MKLLFIYFYFVYNVYDDLVIPVTLISIVGNVFDVFTFIILRKKNLNLNLIESNIN